MTDNIDRAVGIAKQIDPDIGPTLEMEKKSLSEEELKAKLLNFFQLNKQAAEIILAHRGQSFEQIKASFNANVAAHVQNGIQIAMFVNNVMNKKGDLSTLANSAAGKVVAADPRLDGFLQANPKISADAGRKEIADDIEKILVAYFTNLKGATLDQNRIIEELAGKVTGRIGEILRAWSK